MKKYFVLVFLLLSVSIAQETLDPDYIYILARRGDNPTSTDSTTGWRDGMFSVLDPAEWPDSQVTLSNFTLRRCFVAKLPRTQKATLRALEIEAVDAKNKKIPTKGYLNYDSLGTVLSAKDGKTISDFITKLRNGTVLPIVDLTTEPEKKVKDATKIDWKAKPLILDLDTIRSGTYTVGAGADSFPTFGGAGGAFADAAALDGNLILTLTSNITESNQLTWTAPLNTYNLTINSASPHNGDVNAGYTVSLNSNNHGFHFDFSGVENDTVFIQDIIVSFTASASGKACVYTYTLGGGRPFFVIHDNIFRGGGGNGSYGIFSQYCSITAYNNMFFRFWLGEGYGFKQIDNGFGPNTRTDIENNAFFRCIYGIRAASTAHATKTYVRNNVIIQCDNAVGNLDSAYGYNNYSNKAMTDASFKSGTGNLGLRPWDSLVIDTVYTSSTFFHIFQTGYMDGGADDTGNTAMRTLDMAKNTVPGPIGLSSGPFENTFPGIDSIAPTSGTDAGGTAFTLYGSAFYDSSGYVIFDTEDTVSVFTAWNDTVVQGSTPAHAAGAVDVILEDLQGGRDTLTDGFTYTSALSVDSIVPDSGSTAGATAVTVFGAGLGASQGTGSLYFDLQAAASIVSWSDDSIQATTPSASRGAATPIVTIDGGSQDSITDGFYYYTTPVISTISPDSGYDDGGTSVTIAGTGFLATQGTGTVTFGDSTAASYTQWHDDTIIVVDKAYHATGNVTVTVTNADLITDTETYKYIESTPTITSISPDSGNRAAGYTATITGDGFLWDQGSGVVKIADSTASVVSWEQTEIVFTMPRVAYQDSTDVSVTTDKSVSDTLVKGFTFLNNPVIDSISKDNSLYLGGDTIVIYGWAFDAPQGTGTVYFGDSTAASYEAWADNEITVTNKPYDTYPTTIDLIVTNDDALADSINFGIRDTSMASATNLAKKKQFGWMRSWLQFSRRLLNRR